MNATDVNMRPIGGFLGLAICDVPPLPDSIWENWLKAGQLAIAAWTARAALRILIEAKQPPRVWLPAYLCREVATAASTTALRFYPLDEELSPDVGFLRRSIRAGDMVLAVDYLGWPPRRAFRDFVAERPEILWVEDRSQALWMAGPPWAEWQLYSPRKLVGVSDGGLLVATRNADLSAINAISNGASEPGLALPELMRFEDAQEVNNPEWYGAFKAREARFSAEPRPISRLTVALLQRIPLAPLIAARQRNFAFLSTQLESYQAWCRSDTGIAPFGLPIMVEDAESLGVALANERLFCSRHWPPSGLAVGAVEFPEAHRLARRLLTLPCDHRYDEDSLMRLVEAVRRLAPTAAGRKTASRHD